MATSQKPAVTVKKSVTPEYIICLEDGKKLKMLKRYLRSRYNLTPEEYRAKWGLPAGLSDGRAELCGATLRIRQEDRSRPHRTGRRGRPASDRKRAARRRRDTRARAGFVRTVDARLQGDAPDPQPVGVDTRSAHAQIVHHRVGMRGDGVKRRRSVPRGTVGKLIGCT